MKRFLIAGLLALSLGACQTVDNLKSAYDTIATANVPATEIIVTANAFDAAKATATNYLRLKKCDGSNGPLCRDPKASAAIIKAVKAGTTARKALEDFVEGHPGKLGPRGAYDVLKSSVSTLRQIFTIYKVGA